MCNDELALRPSGEPKPKTEQQALRSLMRLCARSEKSSGDALRLMHKWQVAVDRRQAVLERLCAERFIDDRRYAEAYVREKSHLMGWGARKIALQLRTKGIAQDVINEALALIDGDAQHSRLREKLRRKLRTTKYSSSYELRGKLMRYALSLGFDYDMAIGAVDELIGEVVE